MVSAAGPALQGLGEPQRTLVLGFELQGGAQARRQDGPRGRREAVLNQGSSHHVFLSAPESCTAHGMAARFSGHRGSRPGHPPAPVMGVLH